MGSTGRANEDGIMKWISVNTRRPQLGQKCYCYYCAMRPDGTIWKGTRVLYYLRRWDRRKRGFCDRVCWEGSDIGESCWPVTHWMPEPTPPEIRGTMKLRDYRDLI